jgi:hypothetical protein
MKRKTLEKGTKRKHKKNDENKELMGVTNSKKVVVYLLKVYAVKAAREKKEIRTQARR